MDASLFNDTQFYAFDLSQIENFIKDLAAVVKSARVMVMSEATASKEANKKLLQFPKTPKPKSPERKIQSREPTNLSSREKTG